LNGWRFPILERTGFDMTLKQLLPFDLKLDTPNSLTAAAIEEGRRIAYDDTIKGYSSMEDLRKAL
jgi:antitoxin component of RelBE/YafQ-DinJ toxin-antitoxin module